MNIFGAKKDFYKLFEGELLVMFCMIFLLQVFSQLRFYLLDFIRIVRLLLTAVGTYGLLKGVTAQWAGVMQGDQRVKWPSVQTKDEVLHNGKGICPRNRRHFIFFLLEEFMSRGCTTLVIISSCNKQKQQQQNNNNGKNKTAKTKDCEFPYYN